MSAPPFSRRRCANVVPRTLLFFLLIAGSLMAAGCATRTSATIREHLIPAPLTSTPDSAAAYAESLVERARALKLASDPAWISLVHYRRTFWGGWESEADGPNFFLSPHGKGSPSQELEATLRAYFATLPVLEGEELKVLQHPICQFPARLTWLTGKLGLDAARLPTPDCSRLTTFRKELEATAVTLVFSSYHVTSPSSAFGHTFLRIHAARNGGADKRDLLDFAIDFGARIDTRNALVYGIKGLTGQFPGEFRRIPYFFKVREYADFDSRDIWNYTLDLSPSEIAALVDHLWELGSTWFDYYYTSENCSYHIASALEAVVPRLRTVDKMRWPVIPADTVKLITNIPGAVRKIEYRPSLRSQFRYRTAGFSDAEKTAVAQLAADPAAPLPADWPPARQVRVIDAASDLVDVKFARELPFDLEGTGAKRKQQLLERRAGIPVISDALAVPMPEAQQPHRGHGSRRFGVLGGASDGAPSIYLDARLALHDLADPAPGYPVASSLEFLPVRARVFFESDTPKIALEHAYFVRTTSLTPVDRFERRMSYRLAVGAVSLDDTGCSRERCVAAQVTFGSGLALASERGRATGWLMLDTQLASGPHLQGLGDAPFRLAAAPTLGLRLRMSQTLHAVAGASLWWLPWQEPTFLAQGTFELRWLLSSPVALAAEGRVQSELEADRTDLRVQLGAYLYF